MTGFYDWVIYISIIFFVIYSALSVNYYNKIAKERMKKAHHFCPRHHNVTPTEINSYQTISITLLGLSIIIFVMKINHSYLGNCSFKGNTSSFVTSIASNSNFWWTFIILVIYSLAIYELATLDKFSACEENVTKEPLLLAINAIAVGIISFIILLYFYFKYIRGSKFDFMGNVDNSSKVSFN